MAAAITISTHASASQAASTQEPAQSSATPDPIASILLGPVDSSVRPITLSIRSSSSSSSISASLTSSTPITLSLAPTPSASASTTGTTVKHAAVICACAFATQLTHAAGAIVGVACGVAGLLLLAYLARMMLCTAREPKFDSEEDNPFHYPIQAWPKAKKAESDLFELPGHRSPAFPSPAIQQPRRPVYPSFPAYTPPSTQPAPAPERPATGDTTLGSSYNDVPGLTPPHTPRYELAPLDYVPSPTAHCDHDWPR